MASKRLVQYDPNTHKPTTVCTFTLKGDKVILDPPDAAKTHNMLKSLVAKGNKLVKPEDGKEYYDALSRLRGTYYEVLENK
jgi:hypothetical protein